MLLSNSCQFCFKVFIEDSETLVHVAVRKFRYLYFQNLFLIPSREGSGSSGAATALLITHLLFGKL